MEKKEIKILLIEDNQGDIRLIKEMLADYKTERFNIQDKHTLSEGLNLLSTELINIILLDLSLPDSTGLDTLYKTYQKASDIPIIVLTGTNDHSWAVKAIKEGIQDYLVKGQFDENILGRAICYAIERNRIGKELKNAEKELKLQNLNLSRKLVEKLDELKSSEERFRQIADSAGEWIWEVDKNGLYTYSSSAVERILGYKREEIVGKKYFYDLFNPDVKADLKKAIFDLFAKKLLCKNVVNPNLHKNGKIVILETNGLPILDDNGNLIGYSGVDTDITDRVNISKELEEQKEWFQVTLSSIGDAVIATDTNLKIIFMNRIASLLTGWATHVAQGKKIHEIFNIINEISGEPAENPIDQVLKERININLANDTVLIAKDGTKINIADSAAPIIDKKNNIIGVVLIFRDITEHKKIEKEIIRKSKILTAINEIFKTALKGENEEEFSKICLTTVENLTGSKFGFIGELNQENRYDTIAISNLGWDACKMPLANATMLLKNMELRGIWARALKDEKSYIINDPSSQSDSVGTPAGHPKIASFLGVPLKQEGKTFGLIALANKNAGYTQDDLETVELISYAIVEALMHKRTEIKLKDSEESLRNLLEQLLASLEFKAKFFASMSHDLRTPLNAIIGFSDLLIEGTNDKMNDEQLDYLEDIKASADVLLELIDTILDYSKIEAGKFELSVCKFNLFSIIEEIKSIVKPLYLKKGLNFYLEGINEQSYLNADPLRFKQVLYNLVDNAIKFTEKGSITLRGIERRDHWEFQIIDTGRGIAKEDFEVVFREFTRIEKDIIKPVSGSGLGLALTKRIIQLHGGNIWFESEVGKGTTFYFTIPKHLRDLE